MDANRVAVLLNIAAVALAKSEFRTAAQLCSRALALEPACKKALLRRAKAHMHRHEAQVAVVLFESCKLLEMMGGCRLQCVHSTVVGQSQQPPDPTRLWLRLAGGQVCCCAGSLAYLMMMRRMHVIAGYSWGTELY